MMEFDYSYLRGFIKEHFGTNAKFAEFLGIGTTALYDRLTGRVPFSQFEINRVGRQSIGVALSYEEIGRLFFTQKVQKPV